MDMFFKLVADLGFPIAAAIVMGYFIFLVIKFILAGVMGSVGGMKGIIVALDNRVKTMNHDVIRIDTLMSNALGVKPDIERIARADGKNDARRDYVGTTIRIYHICFCIGSICPCFLSRMGFYTRWIILLI